MNDDLKLIVYVSRYLGDRDEVDQVLNDIIEVAKRDNVTFNITGLLFYHEGSFLQVIEGSTKSLEGLISILEKDERHDNIEILIDEAIDERGFSSWNMDSFNLSNSKDLDREDLRSIRNSFKNVFEVESRVIMDFYKTMLVENDD